MSDIDDINDIIDSVPDAKKIRQERERRERECLEEVVHGMKVLLKSSIESLNYSATLTVEDRDIAYKAAKIFHSKDWYADVTERQDGKFVLSVYLDK